MTSTSAPTSSGSTGFIIGDLLLKYNGYIGPATSGRSATGIGTVDGSKNFANAVYTLGAMVSDTTSLLQLQSGLALAAGKSDYLGTMRQIGSYGDLIARPIAVFGGAADGIAGGISAYNQPRMTLGSSIAVGAVNGVRSTANSLIALELLPTGLSRLGFPLAV